MLLKKYICLSAATLLTACDLIDYHPYDGRLDSDTSREINPTNIERIEKVCEGKDTIRFIFMGDTQRSYNETEDFVKYVNQLDSIDFIIHGGDYTEFGLKKEFEWNDDILSKLKVPYVGLIGNHDVIGNGDQVFRKIFGNENFSFVVSDVKFVCLNTNAIEYDYSHPVPDFNFLKNEIADSTRNKRTIVVMHAPPGNEQFDNNVKDVFQLYIKTLPSLMFCLHAHNHCVSAADLFEDGIIEKFVGENAAKDLKGTKDLKETAVKSENEEKETKEISELEFRMSGDTKIREESRRNSSEKIISALKDGKDVAMITLGDVSVYSTCTYVHNAVKNAGFELEIIPGITSFCAAADKAQISLCEGNESVAIIPSLKSNLLEKYIADFDTVVIMKSGNDTDVIYDILKKYGLENNAIVSSCIGMENEIIEKIQKGKSYGYFTTVIVRK